MPAPLLIVDGDNLAHRAYHSTPKTVVTADGQPINAIVGFFSMLIRIWQEERPRGVFVAWDTLGIDTYRSKLWPPYQTGRVFEDSIVEQLGRLPDLCLACGFGIGKQAGYEADDLMASACLAEVAQGGTCLLLTTDRDSYQLVSDRVTVLSPRRGTPILARIGPLEVVKELGVLPEQVPCYKALAGDSSDKIPGAKGVGPKTAAALLLRQGTLEGVVASWVATDAAQCLMFREVVRMRPEVRVELPDGEPNWKTGAAKMRELGAATLADRILALAA
ncbi:MAG: 5'-3' exonuclease [Fimbriimonadaceae bacterium]